MFELKAKGRHHMKLSICKKGDYGSAWSDLKRKLGALEDKDVDTALKICKGELI